MTEKTCKVSCSKSKAWAIASMVCGIIGLLLWLMPYFGIILSVMAIVFYCKDKESAMAKAGLVTGIIGTVMNSAMLFFLFIWVAIVGSL